MIKVLKFGGTSMGSAMAMKQIEIIVNDNLENNHDILMVCSAISGVTNKLIKLGQLAYDTKKDEAMKLFDEIRMHHLSIAKELKVIELVEKDTEPLFAELKDLIRGIVLIKDFSERSRAYLLSFGEKLSTRILSLYLKSKDINSKQFDARFIKTKGRDYLKDEVNWQATSEEINKTITPCLFNGTIPIITGFWGVDEDDIIRLLGRGGSDFSAAILAVSLNISVVEIWTDVDGFLSADPRIVNNASIIDEIGFQEASELCFYGAKVLHPKTIRPIIEKDGEVWIKNTFSPQQNGTKISKQAKKYYKPVISISSKEVVLITLDLFATRKNKTTLLSDVFQLSKQKEIIIDMIAISEAQLSFCLEINQKYYKKFLKQLDKICSFTTKSNRSIICIVSPKEVKGQIGVAGKIFTSISQGNVSIDMYSQNASEIAQLVVVQTKDANNVIQNIHDNLVLNPITNQSKQD